MSISKYRSRRNLTFRGGNLIGILKTGKVGGYPAIHIFFIKFDLACCRRRSLCSFWSFMPASRMRLAATSVSSAARVSYNVEFSYVRNDIKFISENWVTAPIQIHNDFSPSMKSIWSYICVRVQSDKCMRVITSKQVHTHSHIGVHRGEHAYVSSCVHDYAPYLRYRNLLKMNLFLPMLSSSYFHRFD